MRVPLAFAALPFLVAVTVATGLVARATAATACSHGSTARGGRSKRTKGFIEVVVFVVAVAVARVPTTAAKHTADAHPVVARPPVLSAAATSADGAATSSLLLLLVVVVVMVVLMLAVMMVMVVAVVALLVERSSRWKVESPPDSCCRRARKDPEEYSNRKSLSES